MSQTTGTNSQHQPHFITDTTTQVRDSTLWLCRLKPHRREEPAPAQPLISVGLSSFVTSTWKVPIQQH